MTHAVEVTDLTKRYRDVTALDDVTITLDENTIHGLFGNNGAGKSTLMSLASAQNFPTSGSVRLFGKDPFHDSAARARLCFIRENQKYPDDFTPQNAFDVAALFFPRWDKGFAGRLAGEFAIPLKRRIKKLSRGQTSAVGAVLGLAARTDIVFFDEPFLGLDAGARQIFTDALMTEFAEHPRTVLLSSHLIDEIAPAIERVIILSKGRVVVDQGAHDLDAHAFGLVGATHVIDQIVIGKKVLHRQTMGPLSSVTVMGTLDGEARTRAVAAGVDVTPVPLQQFVIQLTDAERPNTLRDHLEVTG
jgi:ABC-2 type transport system ATP-binding protein